MHWRKKLSLWIMVGYQILATTLVIAIVMPHEFKLDALLLVTIFCAWVFCVFVSILSAIQFGHGIPDDEDFLVRNDIYETLWTVRENDRYGLERWAVCLRKRNGNEMIFRMKSNPPKIFKVVGKEKYEAYPPPGRTLD